MNKPATDKKTRLKGRYRDTSRKAMAIAMTVFVVLAGLLGAIAGIADSAMTVSADTGDELLETNRAMRVESNEIPNWPQGPIVGAESAILIDADTGVILYEKNVHAKQFPASTTKILTCLIAKEMCENDEVVTFSKSAVFDTPRDSNNIAIDVGESLTVEECLQAILIRSANECAFAVAEHITGSDWQSFADIMNKRAQELGCVDSNFVNPNGLPDDNHYTSAYDLAQIGRAFFANQELCDITMTPRLHIYPSANQPDEIIENSTVLILPGKTYAYEYLIGAKTGYTDAARSCLVSCAEKDGTRLVCVVMRDEAPYQYLDTINLFDYGFSNFYTANISETETKYNISTTGSFYSGVDVLGNSTPILALNTQDYIIVPKTVDFADLTSEISYDTQDPREAAIITYSYYGVYLGSAAVEFAVQSDSGYTFDELPASVAAAEEVKEETEEEKVVFVNVTKIAIIVGASLASILVVYWIVKGIISYRKRHPNWRAEWKRDRRRRKQGKQYLTLHQEAMRHRAAFREEGRRRNRGRKSLSRRLGENGPDNRFGRK
ncbi:MAG: D-alanyl-D-alanine carboxypeptidase [Lachnospiraceae bacterium]|nr:D-alanyl-D-alanine carboxypeptidase [Lachnospiraceae bacterium]